MAMTFDHLKQCSVSACRLALVGALVLVGLQSACADGESSKPTVDWSKTTRILYRYQDRSVEPKYNRSYEIDVSPSIVKVKVDCYGKILAQKSYDITREQFDGLLASLSRNDIRNVGPRDAAIPVVSNNEDYQELLSHKEALDQQRKQLELDLASFNSECSSVSPDDTVKMTACQSRHQELQQRMDNYKDALAVYNDVLGVHDDGCTGGTSETISTFNQQTRTFTGTVYHCGGEDSGNLGGNVHAFADDLRALVPDFSELLHEDWLHGHGGRSITIDHADTLKDAREIPAMLDEVTI